MQPKFHTSLIRDCRNFYRLRLCGLARDVKQQRKHGQGEHLLARTSGTDRLSGQRSTQRLAPMSAREETTLRKKNVHESKCLPVDPSAGVCEVPPRDAPPHQWDWRADGQRQKERGTCRSNTITGISHNQTIILCPYDGAHRCEDTTCSGHSQKNTPLSLSSPLRDKWLAQPY